MEKKTKKKFWGTLGSYLLTFMFISSWAVLGVALALSVANVNVGGNISFTAKDVRATIAKVGTGVTGGTLTNADEKLKDIVFTAADGTGADTTKSASWQGLDITFVRDETTGTVADVVLTFTITSNDDEKNVLVNIGDLDATYVNAEGTLTVTKGAEATAVADKTAISLANNEYVTVKMTFKVTDANKTAKVTGFNLPIELKAENA